MWDLAGSGSDFYSGEFATFALLPDPTLYTGKFAYVTTSTGVWFINRKEKGFYYSNGTSWDTAPDIVPVFSDNTFQIYDEIDSTKKIKFDAGAKIATGQTRTITVPDYNYDLENPAVDSVQFALTNTETPAEGKLYWNDTEKTLEVGMPGGNVNLQIGQELLLRAKNTEGAQINNGQVVRISGASGAIPHVVLVNNLEEISDDTIAIATENVPNNNNGYFTTEGLVRDINTIALTEGATVWLGSTDGSLTTTTPTAPSNSVKVGYCVRQHATEGVIYAHIDTQGHLRDRQITKEPTGFNGLPSVSYNYTNRTITLTGTVEAYYQGQRITEFTNGWVSTAHTATNGLWYLSHNGTAFSWSQTPWTFDQVQIAIVRYTGSATTSFALVETHGLMPSMVHLELHKQIGTFLDAGGDLGSFVTGSTTAGDRRPTVSSATIYDEDIQHTLATLTSDLYTQRYLTGAGATIAYAVDSAEIIPVLSANPYYNQFTGGAWQQTLFPNNAYGAVFLMAVPVTSDATSQKFRYTWIQPQTVSTTLATIQSITPSSINLGESANLIAEYVFIGKIIVRYNSGNWVITSVEKLTGNRINQTTSPSGTFLTAVSTNTTLTGNGTAGTPLAVNPDLEITTLTLGNASGNNVYGNKANTAVMKYFQAPLATETEGGWLELYGKDHATKFGQAVIVGNSSNASSTSILSVFNYNGSTYTPLLNVLKSGALITNTTPTNVTAGTKMAEGTGLNINTEGTIGNHIVLRSFASSGTGGNSAIALRSGRGTLASPSQTLSGDDIGTIVGGGIDNLGNESPNNWRISGVATENYTATACGTDLAFLLTPTGTIARAEKFRMKGSGAFIIGTTPTGFLDGTNFTINASAAGGTVIVRSIGGAIGGSPALGFNAGRGPLTTPTQTKAGDSLGALFFSGVTDLGASSGNPALIGVIATNDLTASAQGTDVAIQLSAINTVGRAERFRFVGDGRIYGTALHNNAGDLTGTTNQYIASGTTALGSIAGANIGAVNTASYPAQWIRVGNVVTVSGQLEIDLVSINTYSIFKVLLPIVRPTNFVAAYQASGVTAMTPNGTQDSYGNWAIQASVGDPNYVNFSCDNMATNNPQILTYTFTYVLA